MYDPDVQDRYGNFEQSSKFHTYKLLAFEFWSLADPRSRARQWREVLMRQVGATFG